MKQPEDNKTQDLIAHIDFAIQMGQAAVGQISVDDVVFKRGRGRPRVENPLTPAERAKRYRASRRLKNLEAGICVTDKLTVTKKDDNETFFLKLKIQQLETQVADYQRFQEQRADDEQRLQRAYDQLRQDLVKAHHRIEELKATEKVSPSVGKLEARIILLNSDNLRLSQDLDSANDSLWQCQARVADLTGALDEVVQVATAGKRVPAHMLKGLMKLLADA